MNTLAQVIVGASICILVLLFTLFIYHRDTIREIRRVQAAKKPRASVGIITGVVDAGGEGRNTKIDSDTLPFSINQKGGAEMTYNFWVWKSAASNIYGSAFEDLSDDIRAVDANNIARANENTTCDAGMHIHDIPLLLKGEPVLNQYKNMCNSGYKRDVLVKCPLIKFDRGTNRITVQFNTYGGPDAIEDGTQMRACTNNGSGSWTKKTAFQFSADGLDDENYIGKWFMVSVVIRDTTSEGIYPLRNKVNCRMYINGVKVLDKFADGSLSDPMGKYSILRQNRAPLYIFPSFTRVGDRNVHSVATANQLQMAGGVYYNYALNDPEIYALYKQRFSIQPVVKVTVSDITWSAQEATESAFMKTA